MFFALSRKAKLQSLLKEYRSEISNGNNEHLTDAIAATTILTAAGKYVKHHRADIPKCVDNLSLSYLYGGCLFENNRLHEKYKLTRQYYYDVPSKNELNNELTQYKQKLDEPSARTCRIDNDKAAALTWLEMMYDTGIIYEGQKLCLNDYELTDFITDERLSSLFSTNLHTQQKSRERSFSLALSHR